MIDLPPGGILLGLGCDLIEVERIRGVLDRQGERFLSRVFTDEERAYCEGMKHPHKHYAARFAAKEAVSKCFTTGIGLTPTLDAPPEREFPISSLRYFRPQAGRRFQSLKAKPIRFGGAPNVRRAGLVRTSPRSPTSQA